MVLVDEANAALKLDLSSLRALRPCTMAFGESIQS